MCTTVVDTDSSTNYSWDGFFLQSPFGIASFQLQTVDVFMENPPMEQIYGIQT